MTKMDITRKFAIKETLDLIHQNKGMYKFFIGRMNTCKTMEEIQDLTNTINLRKNDHRRYLSELKEYGINIGPINSELNYLEIRN